MSTQLKETQPPRNEDDILIAEGEMVFGGLIGILVGAFGTFGAILLGVFDSFLGL